MISREQVESIVCGVLERLEETKTFPASQGVVPDHPTRPATSTPELYEQYRLRYLQDPPQEQRFSVEFDSSISLELGYPKICIYEPLRSCDRCGRCQVLGF